MSETKNHAGIEELRTAVEAMNHLNEAFLYRFTAEELLAIWRAWSRCEWDFRPDVEWESRQVREAINGIQPQWRDRPNGYEAVYDGPEKIRAGVRVAIPSDFAACTKENLANWWVESKVECQVGNGRTGTVTLAPIQWAKRANWYPVEWKAPDGRTLYVPCHMPDITVID